MLADSLRLPLGVVSYHVRQLREAQQISLVRTSPRRGFLAHHYRLSNRDATRKRLHRAGFQQPSHPETDSLPSEPRQKISRVIGELRRRREAQGLSLSELASCVGIEPSYLDSIELGGTDPGFSVLVRIAHELGTTIGEVFTAAES